MFAGGALLFFMAIIHLTVNNVQKCVQLNETLESHLSPSPPSAVRTSANQDLTTIDVHGFIRIRHCMPT